MINLLKCQTIICPEAEQAEGESAHYKPLAVGSKHCVLRHNENNGLSLYFPRRITKNRLIFKSCDTDVRHCRVHAVCVQARCAEMILDVE